MSASVWTPGYPLYITDRTLRVPLGERVNDVPGLTVRRNRILGFDALGMPVARDLIPGPRGPQGIQGPRGVKGDKGDPGVQAVLNVIGQSATTAGLPVSAFDGDAWIVGSGDSASIYIWSNSQWNLVLEFIAPGSIPVPRVLYVTMDGSDSNSGTNLTYALATIQAALAIAADEDKPCVVSVYPGTYVEPGELAVPDNCGVVSMGGQFVTDIVAAVGDETKNMFLVGSGSYVQGFSFRNQQVDDFDDPTGGFAVAFRPGALILRSPYIRDISQVSGYFGEQIAPPLDPANGNPSIPKGGGVLLADRDVLNPNSIFPYMLAFGATPRSPNGMGYVAKNGAGINGISSISIFQRCAFYALDGGQITLNNSGTQFGDISMRAKGSMLVVSPESSVNSLVQSATAAQAIADNSAAIIDSMWTDLVVGGYTAGWPSQAEVFTRRDAANLLKALEYDLYGGTETSTQGFVLGLFTYNAQPVFQSSYKAAFLYSFVALQTAIEVYVTDPAERLGIAGLLGLVSATVDTPTTVSFGSLVESLGHQFNNAGAGVNKNALPLNFRRGGRNRPVPYSILQEAGGRVRWSGADEQNNQYLGAQTRINGQTGKFEGAPFSRGVRQIARRISNSRGMF